MGCVAGRWRNRGEMVAICCHGCCHENWGSAPPNRDKKRYEKLLPPPPIKQPRGGGGIFLRVDIGSFKICHYIWFPLNWLYSKMRKGLKPTNDAWKCCCSTVLADGWFLHQQPENLDVVILVHGYIHACSCFMFLFVAWAPHWIYMYNDVM